MDGEAAAAAAPLKPKKAKKKNDDAEKLDSLVADVAAFASSIGFGDAGPSAGFDDSDFRKRRIAEEPKPQDLKPKAQNDRGGKADSDKPVPKEHPLHKFDPFSRGDGGAGDVKYPLMKPSSLSAAWHVDSAELEEKVLGNRERKDAGVGVDGNKVGKFGGGDAAKAAKMGREVGELLLKQYGRQYDAEKKGSRGGGEIKMIKETVRSGTSTDRVSAFVVLVHDNPIANVRALDGLLSMVTSKVGKRHAFTGFSALRDLFRDRLLPDRKLKFLTQRPLHTLPENKDGYSLLLFWYWEECLKQRYEKFIIALEEASRDILPTLKDTSMKMVYELLMSKSEQERRLLSALVNKLGDPVRKAASTASYHLTCLLSEHPNMKAVVIDEVELFMFRPHVGMRAKYYAVNFLNKFFLSKKGDGPKIAKRLVDVYFAVFKVVITGYEKEHDKRIGKSREQNGKKGDFRASKSHTSKEQEGAKESVEMDSRLLSALLTGVNRAFPYVASEEADDIIEVQMPVLFRLVHSENFNVGVQALMLLYHITVKNQIASDRFYRALYAKFLSPAAITSSKTELFVNLLTKAMKNDVNIKRIAAFSKRLLQVALQRPPEYACGCLFLLSEVLKAKPPLWTLVLQKESIDDDDLEHFDDIVEDPEENTTNALKDGEPMYSQDTEKSTVAKANGVNGVDKSDPSPTLGATTPKGVEKTHPSNTVSTLPGGYNPKHREPTYCNADRTSWWELSLLSTHVHPSVATMARTLLSGANIVFNGDPLYDLALPAFLDKFKEKKPKANPITEGKWHGGSQIAPARKLDLNPRLIGEDILQLAEEDVAPEDVVFHRFYMNRSGTRKRKAKKSGDDNDDDDELLPDVSDESEEEEADEVLGTGIRTEEEDEEEFDYDDLDRIDAEDDDELLGDGTEAGDAGGHSSMADDPDTDEDDPGDDFPEIFDDSGDELENAAPKGKAKLKTGKKTRASPFVSLEEYEQSAAANAVETSRKLRPKKKSKRRKTD